jgi:uncharacterized membrane protein
MKKSNIFMAVAAAVSVIASAAYAEVAQDMEKCKVVDPKTGKGLIKPHKGSCGVPAEKTDCAGTNEAGDPNAFIIVPKGQCAKINAGDFSGVTAEIKDSIEGAK